MKPLIIKHIEFIAIGDENLYRPRWADYLNDIFTTNIICKITTNDGLIGISGSIAYTELKFDTSMLETLKLYVPLLIGKSALDREAIFNELLMHPTLISLPAISIIDIALWDLVGKHANLPIYQLLGAARDEILSYASTPLLDNNEEYVTYCNTCLKEGFKAIKIHPYTSFKKDLPLVELLSKEFGGKVGLMLDVDGRYQKEEALKMALRLQELNWEWFEAPLPDRDLQGYKWLRDRSFIPISCGGNALISLLDINTGVRADAWSDIRADVTVCGGFSGCKKIASLAKANNMRFEIQSWGHTLTQAANLHLMLSIDNCTYFEQAFPYLPFELASKDVIRTDKNGFVRLNKKAGLGIELDFDLVEKFKIASFSSKNA